jgi:hypothetical protein
MTGRALLSIAIAMPWAFPAATAAKLSKTTRELQGLPEPARHQSPPRPSQAAAPRLTVEAFISEQRERIQDISDKQIGYLQRLIVLTSPDDPQLPDYQFRLGDLLAEKHRYLSHRTRSLDEPIFLAEQAHDTDRAARHRRAPRAPQRLVNRTSAHEPAPCALPFALADSSSGWDSSPGAS